MAKVLIGINNSREILVLFNSNLVGNMHYLSNMIILFKQEAKPHLVVQTPPKNTPFICAIGPDRATCCCGKKIERNDKIHVK